MRYYDKVALKCKDYSTNRTKEYVQLVLFPGKRGTLRSSLPNKNSMSQGSVLKNSAGYTNNNQKVVSTFVQDSFID